MQQIRQLIRLHESPRCRDQLESGYSDRSVQSVSIFRRIWECQVNVHMKVPSGTPVSHFKKTIDVTTVFSDRLFCFSVFTEFHFPSFFSHFIAVLGMYLQPGVDFHVGQCPRDQSAWKFSFEWSIFLTLCLGHPSGCALRSSPPSFTVVPVPVSKQFSGHSHSHSCLCRWPLALSTIDSDFQFILMTWPVALGDLKTSHGFR